MKILALDASTQALSIALLESDKPDRAIEHFEVAPRAHATRLLPLIQKWLDHEHWSLSDVSAMAFGRGPGAFTGLRIATGLVQGLASGVGCPVVPVSTLAALARRAFVADEQISRVRVVQDARMGEIYTADFQRCEQDMPLIEGEERVIEPGALSMPTNIALGYAGNGWHLVDDSIAARVASQDCVLPHALDIARLAVAEIKAGRAVEASQAQPVYVRDDVARKPQSPSAPAR